MIDGVFLGLIQGVFEWLPVSSEGVLVAFMSVVSELSSQDAIRFALWLHLGTCISAVIVFRSRIYSLLVQMWETKTTTSTPEARFLTISTITSFFVGGLILLTIDMLLERAGVVVIVAVGACMVLTGILQLRRRAGSRKEIHDLTVGDALWGGLAQGLAVVPGFSRSGFTVATLVWRGYGFKDCLELSILMSIPASLGAGLVGGLTASVGFEWSMLVATVIAAATGLLTIRVLLAFSERFSLGILVMLSGAAMLLAGLL